jgi:enamidase
MSVLVKNAGLVLTGQVAAPIADADSLVIADGLIQEVGKRLMPSADTVIDAKGSAVAPGLIDSHCHVVFGDYSPRQQMSGFLDSSLHGGVTTSISAGEVHLPGRPKDAQGAKALAILAAKAWANLRPGGMKVLGGSLILEKGLTKDDLAECAAAGCKVVGEVGLGSVKEPAAAAEMIAWAKSLDMVVMMHTGGTSIPGSSVVGPAEILAAKPSIASHLNGGPTAVDEAGAREIIEKSDCAIELVQCGNLARFVDVCRIISERGELGRVILGNDAPSGTGVVTLGILRNLGIAASLGGVAPEIAVCWATGNTAALYGLNRGVIAPGKEADLVFLDTPMGSPGADVLEALRAGDTPGVSLIMVDGQVVAAKSRNTPPAVRQAVVV